VYFDRDLDIDLKKPDMKLETSIPRKPETRRLRAYAFDPSLSLQIDTAKLNKIVYEVDWEDLEVGPVGEYIEVIDYDPTTDSFYNPVNLNDLHIVADGGLRPSVSNPQFHQQMVYAVAMITIQNFEKALGRKVLWAPRLLEDPDQYEEYVPRLRVYPHALRDANAFYSPYRKSLLFGYFTSTPANRVLHMPNSLVFTCLSHDIIAHEVTHAILDGIHRDYNNPTNPDVLAFHEAFADIVALFQHFAYPEVLKYEISKTKGDLRSQNLLGKLAQELGSAIGGYGSLRDAIGKTVDGEWTPTKPNPEDYQNVMEPHARGSILVAAVFDAFLTIYQNRIDDLLRIARSGLGELRGDLHPDLVNRLAGEAAKSAKHVLNMCIRALDYCPPVDITFGDYLRAIITADADLLNDDQRDYRLAFVDAFRKRGIYPHDIRSLSIESLRFYPIDLALNEEEDAIGFYSKADLPSANLLRIILEFLKEYADEIKYVTDRKDIYHITRKYIAGGQLNGKFVHGLHHRIRGKFGSSPDFSEMTGLIFSENPNDFGIEDRNGFSSFQIQNLRIVSRVGPNGKQLNHVIFSIFQRCRLVYNEENDKMEIKYDAEDKDSFYFYGGCTFIFDLNSKKLKYIISKPLLDFDLMEQEDNRGFFVNLDSALRQYKYQEEEIAMHMGRDNLYFGSSADDFRFIEPFALLHQH